MFSYYALPPSASVQDFVYRYLVFEGHLAPGQYLVQDVIPALTEFITFNMNGTPQFFKVRGTDMKFEDCFVTGLHSQTYHASLQGNIRLIGVQIKSPALSRLFNVPLKYMANHALTLYDLIGREADLIREQIIEKNTITESIKVIEHFLLHRMLHSKISRVHSSMLHALQLINDSRGTMSLKEVLNHTQLSERSLQRIFLNQVGITPKMYARVRKFNEVVRYFNTHKQFSPDLIYQLGYYDQAHFIHDFKNLSGQSPLTYFKNHPGVNEFFTSL